MQFAETTLPGVLRVDAEPQADERGAFTRLHCEREFAARGLPQRMVQTSLSHTRRRGSVRGLHFQWPPSQEAKLVRCLTGRVFDVVVDLRPASAAFTRHVAVELAAPGATALFIPPGCAHGFQALDDDCVVLYQMTDFHAPALAAGVRWNDAAFGIVWPLAVTDIHPRDAGYADFDAAAFERALAARRGATASG
jgi:dTDP-4-dehydrorhamnose 3,5-epimerase